jgi:peptidoglycan/LPS O-acetylase OafA/YrhL
MRDMGGAPRRFGHHDNAFGALRLLFASLVIASHAPELVDGDAHREILTRITGTISFGKLAVIGFFVISGYLVTGSLLNSRPLAYLAKRVARIYPAFLVAFAISILLVAPLAGAVPPTSPGDIFKRAFDAFALQPPWVPGVFAGSHYAGLNGSMWTIAYEFRCYGLILLLGVAGLLRRPGLILAMTAIALMLTMVFPGASSSAPLSILAGRWHLLSTYGLGDPRYEIRFIGAFLTGACFYLYRDRMTFTRARIGLAAIGLAAGLLIKPTSVVAAIAFGGYLIFATARHASWLNRINNENDISYGVYLYAWPITKLLNWWWPWMHPLAVGLLTLAGACLCGWVSWRLVEKPALELVRRRPWARAIA